MWRSATMLHTATSHGHIATTKLQYESIDNERVTSLPWNEETIAFRFVNTPRQTRRSPGAARTARLPAEPHAIFSWIQTTARMAENRSLRDLKSNDVRRCTLQKLIAESLSEATNAWCPVSISGNNILIKPKMTWLNPGKPRRSFQTASKSKICTINENLLYEQLYQKKRRELCAKSF